MGDADINTLTMEQYVVLTRGYQAPGMVKPKIEGNVNFDIKRVTHDAVMLHVFPITLIRAAKRSTSRRVSNDSSVGIATIINKLDSLGRDIKKLKENVHAIQVGCENCGGAHLNKEYPLNEEVKSVKKVKSGEFG
ncbi:hypothetical protein Tco_1335760 [Tanacetum coccineum]